MRRKSPVTNTQVAATNRKQQPWWAVPTVFGIILVSSGIFVVLLAAGISILSNVGY
jgi:hypothetical protein